MLVRLAKAAPNVFSQTTTGFKRLPVFQLKPFSSIKSLTMSEQIPYETIENSVDNLPAINPQVSTYMKELYKYLAAASVVGISSAHLIALTAPIGFPSAFLVLTGFGLQHIGTEYVNKTRPQTHTYKDADGKIQHGSSNSMFRKLGFLSSCLGYSCIIGSLLGMIPLSPAALPVSAITCLFSTLGHLAYCKFAPKNKFKSANLFISGLFTGVLGLNFLTSSSMMLMWESALHLESLQASTYVGMLLYNAFAGSDSQKTVEDVRAGKGDYLKHANQFSENWLYALIPHFLMGL